MLDIDALRAEFPALAGQQIYLDGPAGTQVPNQVIRAVTAALVGAMSNVGGTFASSYRSGAGVDAARRAGADLTGGDPEEIVFGPNMTSLTFALSRAVSENWKPGERIVLSGLDHDANVTPWVRAAASRGVEVVYADIRADTTLDVSHLLSLITPNTRLVAVTACSNAFGTLTDVARITSAAREVGALSYVDAVHLAPHRFIDVNAMGCDFLVCSSYKFFGPHLGILWGQRSLARVAPSIQGASGPRSGASPLGNRHSALRVARRVHRRRRLPLLARLGRGPARGLGVCLPRDRLGRTGAGRAFSCRPRRESHGGRASFDGWSGQPPSPWMWTGWMQAMSPNNWGQRESLPGPVTTTPWSRWLAWVSLIGAG